MLHIGDVLFGGVPDMFNGIMVRRIRRHGDQVNLFQDTPFLQ
jgi:hypothetical protein